MHGASSVRRGLAAMALRGTGPCSQLGPLEKKLLHMSRNVASAACLLAELEVHCEIPTCSECHMHLGLRCRATLGPTRSSPRQMHFVCRLSRILQGYAGIRGGDTGDVHSICSAKSLPSPSVQQAVGMRSGVLMHLYLKRRSALGRAHPHRQKTSD